MRPGSREAILAARALERAGHARGALRHSRCTSGPEMRVVLFCQSLISCWNHRAAHFLRGIATELVERGHDVMAWEPGDSSCTMNLVRERGPEALDHYKTYYPQLSSQRYELARLDLDRALDGADVVLVHEWNAPELIARIGEHRARARSYRLLFHDTHHRAATAPQEMLSLDLRNYDGVLAAGVAIRELYLWRGWAERAWNWHQAADIRMFQPMLGAGRHGDVVWIGNWGSDDRAAEISEFLLTPVRALQLRTHMFGVRYPGPARLAAARAGAMYRGWLPNHQVARTYSRYAVTVNVPKRDLARALPGVPGIRTFEALACGIPLVSSPWEDVERLFVPGRDYLVARDGMQMTRHLRDIASDRELARELADSGRKRILDRHTCAHRVDELMEIVCDLNAAETRPAA